MLSLRCLNVKTSQTARTEGDDGWVEDGREEENVEEEERLGG